MILTTLTLLAAMGGAAAAVDGEQYAQLTIQQRVVIRVPLAPVQVQPLSAPMRWTEKKGPKCVGLGDLAGFAVRTPQVVDLFMRGGQRIRTRLEKQCTSVDLGYGFYVRPNPDGRMCRGRDALRSRSGGECHVERFTSLVPAR